MSNIVVGVQSLFPDQISDLHACRREDLLTMGGGWFRGLQSWAARSGQRRALRELAETDDHLLQDIGKSRGEALQEAAKPFWRR